MHCIFLDKDRVQVGQVRGFKAQEEATSVPRKPRRNGPNQKRSSDLFTSITLCRNIRQRLLWHRFFCCNPRSRHISFPIHVCLIDTLTIRKTWTMGRLRGTSYNILCAVVKSMVPCQKSLKRNPLILILLARKGPCHHGLLAAAFGLRGFSPSPSSRIPSSPGPLGSSCRTAAGDNVHFFWGGSTSTWRTTS